MKHDKPYDGTVYQSLAMITQFGLNMLVPIGMMTAVGVWLDQKFETGWITILLFFVGAIAGGRNVYRMAKKVFSDNHDAKRYIDGKVDKESIGESVGEAEKKE